MPNITDANYPTEDGWNHAEIELKEGESWSSEEMESFLLFAIGGPTAKREDYEIITGEQDGLVIKGAIRATC